MAEKNISLNRLLEKVAHLESQLQHSEESLREAKNVNFRITQLWAAEVEKNETERIAQEAKLHYSHRSVQQVYPNGKPDSEETLVESQLPLAPDSLHGISFGFASPKLGWPPLAPATKEELSIIRPPETTAERYHQQGSNELTSLQRSSNPQLECVQASSDAPNEEVNLIDLFNQATLSSPTKAISRLEQQPTSPPQDPAPTGLLRRNPTPAATEPSYLYELQYHPPGFQCRFTLTNIPSDATLTEVLALVRGDAIISCALLSTPAPRSDPPPPATLTATVRFGSAAAAHSFVAYARERALVLHGRRLGARMVPSATRPLGERLVGLMARGYTRCLRISGVARSRFEREVASIVRPLRGCRWSPVEWMQWGVGEGGGGWLELRFVSILDAAAAFDKFISWWCFKKAGVRVEFLKDPCDRMIEDDEHE